MNQESHIFKKIQRKYPNLKILKFVTIQVESNASLRYNLIMYRPQHIPLTFVKAVDKGIMSSQIRHINICSYSLF